MILNPGSFSECSGSPIVRHVTTSIEDICGGQVALESSHLAEIARAIEAYLSLDPGCKSVESTHLVMLASQALSSLGEKNQARRLLVFGTGLVRPAEWEVSQGGTMWVLDLKRISCRGDAQLEMLLFNSLSLVLESMADVWDETDGKGQLGLRHVCTTADSLIGSGGDGGLASMVSEIMSLCRDRLGEIGGRRGWGVVPGVINLDGVGH